MSPEGSVIPEDIYERLDKTYRAWFLIFVPKTSGQIMLQVSKRRDDPVADALMNHLITMLGLIDSILNAKGSGQDTNGI